MTSAEEDALVSDLNTASMIIVLVFLSISFAIGIIGLLLNLIVFTRPNLRREPSSIYFLSSTCFNLFVAIIIIPVRILSNSFNIELAYINLGICKVEFYTFYCVRTISCWLITFACIDRYLHSSPNVHLRQRSSLKTAKLTIAILILSILLLYSHMIPNMTIRYSRNHVVNCNSENETYRTFLAMWYLILYSVLPSLLMIVFGLLTLKNIRKMTCRINETTRLNRRRDVQLFYMLIGQVLMIILSTLPQSINQLYLTFTSNLVQDKVDIAKENLLSKTLSGLTFYAHSTSFYLFTLSGTIFRKELSKFIREYFCFNRNRVRVQAQK